MLKPDRSGEAAYVVQPHQIPDAVVEAALRKRGLMREAIADALNAWPGAFPHPLNKTRLVLPLPEARSADAKHQQEGSDE